jgi:two-component system aerobic respiration control sensor histidine kinase ArcB
MQSNLSSILLVEDDTIIQKIMCALLTKLNCQVNVAINVHSAITMAKENHYDLIFLDIGLPDGSGYDVAAKIRHDTNCPNQGTPIVAVTAHDDLKSRKEYQLVGINDVLSKPVSEMAVREALNLFVGKV